MSLSGLSAGGLTQPHTMKLQREVRGKKVLILIDSGANHNFISKDLMEELGLKVEDTPVYSVKLGDGFWKGTRGCCKEVIVRLDKHIIKERLYLYELGVDVILAIT